MSQDKQKSIAAMRTFARDLDRERGHSDADSSKPTEPKTASKKERREHTAAAPKAVADVPTSPTPAAIPAFHELQKSSPLKVATPTLQAPTTIQKPASNDIPQKTPVSGGMIITDTKIERTPFFSALATSLTAWIASIKKQLEPSKKQTYSVTSTERRRGVVQKATSKTGAMFSANKAELAAIIRKRQRETSDDSHEPELDWSPFTEPGYLLLDGEHDAIINQPVPAPKVEPVVAKPPVTMPVFVPPSPPTPVVPITPVAAPVTPVITPTPVPVEVPAPLPPIPAPAPQPVAAVAQSIPAPTPTTTEDESEEEYAPDEPEIVPQPTNFWSLEHLTNLSTNEMTMVVVSGLLVVAAISSTLYLTLTTPAPTTTVEVAVGPTALTTLTPRPLSLTPTDSSLVLISEAADVERAVELFTVRSNGNSDASLLSDIASADGETFVQASREVRLVVTSGGERALLVPIVDTVNARGGLLDWERSMYRDLTTIFTAVPRAAVTATFSDASLLGVDTRQVRDGDAVVLMYGFVNSELVLIAPSALVFSEVMSLLKK